MPAKRTNIWDLVNMSAGRAAEIQTSSNRVDQMPPTLKATRTAAPVEINFVVNTLPEEPAYFPRSDAERACFRTKAGRKVTPHQWAVYDYILNIPRGNIATYKSVCDGLGQGSPRSVGSALRNNPFAPYVPCHRVIASDLYLGGYCGEWGPQSKTGTQFNRKLQLLKEEGIEFDEKGMLQSKDKLV